MPVTINTTDAGGTGIAGYYLSESVTAPTVGGGGWINKPSTFALSATDAVKTVYIWVKDNNGSLSARAQASTRLDTTLPTATLTTAATATAWNIAVTLGGTDAGSGITAWSVVAGSTAPSASSNAWKSVAPTTFQLSSGNGVKTVSAFSRDAAGNVSLAATKTVTMTVPVPSVTISMTSPINYRNNPSLNPITNDPGQTGINGYFVSESGTTPLLTDPGWKPFVNITLSAGDGTKTVYLWVKDNNGSISARASATTLVDTTLPTATLAALTYGGTTTVAVTIGGTDAGSGITAWAVVEGTSAPSWGDPNWVTPVPTSIIVSDGTGIHTVSAFTRDAAGNVSLAATRTVTLP